MNFKRLTENHPKIKLVKVLIKRLTACRPARQDWTHTEIACLACLFYDDVHVICYSITHEEADMPEIQIRLATSDDSAIIAHHRHRMFAEMGAGTVQSRAHMDSHFDIWLRQRFEENTYFGWFACDGEKIISTPGFCR